MNRCLKDRTIIAVDRPRQETSPIDQRGAAFYATWWIRQADRPQHYQFRAHDSRSGANSRGEKPRDTGSRADRAQLWPNSRSGGIGQRTDVPLPVVEKIVRLPRDPLSLHTPIVERPGKLLAHYIEDRGAVEPGEHALNQRVWAATRKHLAILTERQEIALRHRFGIGMDKEHTLQEIGDMFVIIRERARQIEMRAPRRLRSRGKQTLRRNPKDSCVNAGDAMKSPMATARRARSSRTTVLSQKFVK